MALKEYTLTNGVRVQVKGISPLLPGQIKKAMEEGGDPEPQPPTYSTVTIAGTTEVFAYTYLTLPIERERPEPPEVPDDLKHNIGYLLKVLSSAELLPVLSKFRESSEELGLFTFFGDLQQWEKEKEDRRNWDKYQEAHNKWQARMNERVLRAMLMTGIKVVMTPEEEAASQDEWEEERAELGLAVPEKGTRDYRYEWISTGLLRSATDLQALTKVVVAGEGGTLGGVIDDMFRSKLEG